MKLVSISQRSWKKVFLANVSAHQRNFPAPLTFSESRSNLSQSNSIFILFLVSTPPFFYLPSSSWVVNFHAADWSVQIVSTVWGLFGHTGSCSPVHMRSGQDADDWCEKWKSVSFCIVCECSGAEHFFTWCRCASFGSLQPSHHHRQCVSDASVGANR